MKFSENLSWEKEKKLWPGFTLWLNMRCFFLRQKYLLFGCCFFFISIPWFFVFLPFFFLTLPEEPVIRRLSQSQVHKVSPALAKSRKSFVSELSSEAMERTNYPCSKHPPPCTALLVAIWPQSSTFISV